MTANAKKPVTSESLSQSRNLLKPGAGNRLYEEIAPDGVGELGRS